MMKEKAQPEQSQPFLTDVKTLRDRAKKNIASGGVTFTYQGDVKKAIDILQSVLATEIVCVLRYTMHAVAATGISSEGVRAEFAEHAKEEQEHMLEVAERINQLGGEPNFSPEGLATRAASEYGQEVAERINQLGGKPDFNPTGLASRAASEYGTADNLVEMIKENLIAERIAVDHYRELIRYFADQDPGTRTMLERILVVEEEHANDMHDLLVAHEGKPMLPAN
jgi:bacterioferritin